MLRVTIEVLPPEGERRVIETIEISRVEYPPPDARGECMYAIRRRSEGNRSPRTVRHRFVDGAVALVAKACATLEDR